MKIKYILFAMLLFVSSAFSQNYYSGLGVVASYPFGNISNMVDKNISFLGAKADLGYYPNQNVFYGISIGWNYFTYKFSGMMTFEEDNGYVTSVTGTSITNINAVPILANIGYNFKLGSNDKVMPFVSLGAGTTFSRQRFQIGVYQYIKTNWHFTIAPEAGVDIKLQNSYTSPTIRPSLKLNYSLSSGKNVFGDSDNSLIYLSLNICILWKSF